MLSQKGFGRRTLDALLIALVIATAIRFLHQRSPRADSDAVPVMTPSIHPGQVLRLPGVEWSGSRHVVLVLSSTCPACNANLPFYRQLGVAAPGHIRTLVVTSEAPAVTESWLKQNDVALQNVLQVKNLPSYGLLLTPTIVFVDATGRVTDVMIRRLDEREQAGVINRLLDSQAPMLDNSHQVREIAAAELGSVQVLDVRGRELFGRGHRSGARNIPIEELSDRAAAELASSKPVVVDCLQPGGAQCRSAAWTLVDLGFSDVAVLIR